MTRHPGPRGRAVVAALLLAAAFGGLAHAVSHELEALHALADAGATPSSPQLEAACPPDCGHHGHLAHDKATCASCRALHAPATRVFTAVSAKAAPVLATAVVADARHHAREECSTPYSRGPPPASQPTA